MGRKLESNEVVHHINGNTKDNRIENLEVMTRSEHAKLHLTGNRISDRHKERLRQLYTGKPRRIIAKLTMEQAAEIKSLRLQGFSVRELGKMYEVSHSTVSDLLSGKTLSYKEDKP